MTGRSPILHDFAGRASRLAPVKRRLRDPAVLTVVAVAFIVSAVGQALMQRYVHDASLVVIAVLSVFASVFLAAAVIVGARRHEQETRTVDRAMTTTPEKVRPSMPGPDGSVYRPGGTAHRTGQGGGAMSLAINRVGHQAGEVRRHADASVVSRTVTVLAGLTAALTAGASALGLFLAGGPGQHEVTTTRGATATLYGEGLYRDDTFLIGVGNRGTDAANLLVEVPLLLVALMLYRRGGLRGRLMLAGVWSYVAYYYTSMAFGTVQNRLFLVYVAIMGLSLFGLVRLIASIDARDVAAAFPSRPSTRVLAGYQFAVAGALTVAWLPPLMVTTISGQIAEVVAVYTSSVTTALDLGLVAPFAIVSAVLLLRCNPTGYLATALLLVLNVAIGTALMGQGVAQVLAEVPMTVGEIVGRSLTFAALTVVASGLIVSLLRNARQAPQG